MPEVYNWQLGRKMLYPYEERHPKWQFAFVFNINRCLACQTCSMADKSTWLFSKGQEYMWWNNVETKPYGGYPQFYDVKITQLIEQVNPGGQVWNVRVGRKHHAPYGVFEGMTIFDAGAKVGQAAIGYIPTDQEWRFVNIYEDTATSMRALVEGIDKTGFSRDEPWKMTGSSLPGHETFFFYLQRIWNHCTHPGCLAACPRGYARQMFGPGVDNAIEKYLVPSRELLAVLQLWRASQQIIFRYDVIPGPKVFETQIHGKRFEMYNDTVLGFNKSGKEVARIQVEEPIYIRPAERVTWL